jgi:hypothetical protein
MDRMATDGDRNVSRVGRGWSVMIWPRKGSRTQQTSTIQSPLNTIPTTITVIAQVIPFFANFSLAAANKIEIGHLDTSRFRVAGNVTRVSTSPTWFVSVDLEPR